MASHMFITLMGDFIKLTGPVTGCHSLLYAAAAAAAAAAGGGAKKKKIFFQNFFQKIILFFIFSRFFFRLQAITAAKHRLHRNIDRAAHRIRGFASEASKDSSIYICRTYNMFYVIKI